MRIRLGYEIEVACDSDMPLVSLLEIHPERRCDIRRETPVVTRPDVESETYADLYGNFCRRFHVPAGNFNLRYDAVIADERMSDSRMKVSPSL